MSGVKYVERVERCFSFFIPGRVLFFFPFRTERQSETFSWPVSERQALLHLLSVRGPVRDGTC